MASMTWFIITDLIRQLLFSLLINIYGFNLGTGYQACMFLVNLKVVGVMPFQLDLLKVLDPDRAGALIELGKRNKSK